LWWKRANEPPRGSEVRLYRITPSSARAPNQMVARCVTASPITAAHLDPRGAFVVHTATHLFVWRGDEAPDELLHHARIHAAHLNRFERVAAQPVVISSSSSSSDTPVDAELIDEFWRALGGKRQVERDPAYDSEYQLLQTPRGPFLWRLQPEVSAAPESPSTLSSCSNTSDSSSSNPAPPSVGNWIACAPHFDRSTLEPHGIFMLHDAMRLFAWVGSRALDDIEDGESSSLTTITESFFDARDMPPKETPVAINHEGNESALFWKTFDCAKK
jgi:hypothetical protein